MYVVITTGPEVIVVVDVRVVAGVPVSMGTHCSYQMLPCVSTLALPPTTLTRLLEETYFPSFLQYAPIGHRVGPSQFIPPPG